MIRRPPRSTQSRSSAASDVYKRQGYGGVGRQDDLLNVAVDARQQLRDVQVVGLHAVQRAQSPAQDVVEAMELPRALDGHDVEGLLDHAEHARVAARVGAHGACLLYTSDAADDLL